VWCGVVWCGVVWCGHRLGEAVEGTLAALPIALPLAARVESIGVITFRPGCDVLSFELGTGRALPLPMPLPLLMPPQATGARTKL
jgi:hypothetical protein